MKTTTHLLLSFSLLALLAACNTTQPPTTGTPPPLEGSEHKLCPDSLKSLRKLSCVAYNEAAASESKSAFDLSAVLYAWAKPDNIWKKKVLSVKFVDGSEAQQAKAWQRFQQWDSILGDGLDFVQVCEGYADIRVAFKAQGHWSYLGNYCEQIPQNQHTMNLELESYDKNDEWDRVALHEIGHAIGLEHEHQSPVGNIKWNEAKVIDFYARTQGWNEAEVRQQVLNKYKGNKYKATEFDPTSLMEYPVPAELTLDGFSVGWNRKLSPLDITFAQELYPSATTGTP